MIFLTYINFEIKDKKLERKNIEDDYKDKNHCCFYFKDKGWEGLEKYVIFWNDENKSFIRYLGEGEKLKCRIPKELENIISIQIYANDNFVTNKVTIGRTIQNKKRKHKTNVINHSSVV